MKNISTDYLVIGSGAMGMAFTDVLLTETESNIVIVDKHHQPGGHWNDAYPFVRLHQPSAFYGVNSKKLGNNTIDATGWNKGLYELATNSEVCGYFDQVMHRQFLSSGRVQYFPSCEYLGNGEFTSLVSGEKYSASFTKEVDATYMNVVIPSKRKPPFEIEDGVHCTPPNELPSVTQHFERYVIVGAGKTAMDAALFLLKNDVSPDSITWIMPRDSWILDRAQIQPTLESIGTTLTNQIVPGSESKSIDEFFSNVSKAGGLLRIDDNVTPTMYRCATVTKAELSQLKRIKNIVRHGRVKTIGKDTINLEGGSIQTDAATLHVDCAADGLAKRPVKPIFEGSKISLQSVRTCQQVFSAAFIGYIESTYNDSVEKNDICKPVPHPNTDIDFLRNNLADSINTARWEKEPKLQRWLQNCRLDFSSHVLNSNPSLKVLSFLSKLPFISLPNRVAEAQDKSIRNIKKLLDELDSQISPTN